MGILTGMGKLMEGLAGFQGFRGMFFSNLGSARETGVGRVARCPSPGVGCFLPFCTGPNRGMRETVGDGGAGRRGYSVGRMDAKHAFCVNVVLNGGFALSRESRVPIRSLFEFASSRPEALFVAANVAASMRHLAASR